MRITRIETLVCDAGWRPWNFVKIETDEGITGYGEISEGRAVRGVLGCVKDLERILLGRDPRAVELLNAEMNRMFRQSPGGVAQKAIGGIDAALWDIKGKALGVPVYELLGGPTRDRVRLYWSHLGTSRVRAAELMGKPPLRSLEDIPALVQEVVSRGFTAFKTNILFPGNPGYVYMPGSIARDASTQQHPPDLNVTSALVRHLAKQMEIFREAAGPEVDIALDLNFNFKTEGYLTIARALEPYDLMWIEIDTYDPKALLQIKQSTTTRIASAENLFTLRGYLPFFDLHALDVAIIDVPWNGFTASKKIADLAEAYEINMAPHNYYSHMSSFMSAHLCAVASNVRIMEIDIDDVPWKDDLVTDLPEIEDGHLMLPRKPGWGTDLNEKEVAKHPWPR